MDSLWWKSDNIINSWVDIAIKKEQILLYKIS